MRISDWSSDVCSSDLGGGDCRCSIAGLSCGSAAPPGIMIASVNAVAANMRCIGYVPDGRKWVGSTGRMIGSSAGSRDRKSVVEGKTVSVRVDLGGRRIINHKKYLKNCQDVSTHTVHTIIY